MKVKECMCNNVEYVNPNTTVSQVAKLMGEKHIGCVPVCDENKNILGLVTDRDLILRCIANEKDCKQTPIGEIMTTDVKTVTESCEVDDATSLMGKSQIRRVLVTEANNNKIVGIITMGDLANNNFVSGNEIGNTVERICNCNDHMQNAE